MDGNLIRMRVLAKTLEAEDTWSFDLVPAASAPLPRWSPGAHIDVHLGGRIRQYSLWNAPEEHGRYRIAVLRDAAGGGGSVQLCDELHEGDDVLVGAPRNHFPLVESARRSLLFAGGIGITPILAMARSLAAEEADFSFHYCSRSPQRAAFCQLLRESDFAHRVDFHYDDGPDDQKLDLSAAVGVPDPDTHLYVCGPGGFIEVVRGAAAERGWHPANIHQEFFANAVMAESGSDNLDFRVRIASTGVTLDVPPGRSIVDVLADAGVKVRVSCEQGVCGECLTGVVEGVPDHRDLYLTDSEHARNDQMLPCCSRAKSDLLVLDL